MRKTFQLAVPGKHPDRLMDAIKHELGKYQKRERQKPLPSGADFWDFDCKFGLTAPEANTVQLSELKGLMDGAKAAGATQFYVELIAKSGVRKSKTPEAQHIIQTDDARDDSNL
jgi:hypothetical protein